MYFCHCQNTLSCIFQQVIQITDFCIGVQKHHKYHKFVYLICLPAQPACIAWEFCQTQIGKIHQQTTEQVGKLGKLDTRVQSTKNNFENFFHSFGIF